MKEQNPYEHVATCSVPSQTNLIANWWNIKCKTISNMLVNGICRAQWEKSFRTSDTNYSFNSNMCVNIYRLVGFFSVHWMLSPVFVQTEFMLAKLIHHEMLSSFQNVCQFGVCLLHLALLLMSNAFQHFILIFVCTYGGRCCSWLHTCNSDYLLNSTLNWNPYDEAVMPLIEGKSWR